MLSETAHTWLPSYTSDQIWPTTHYGNFIGAPYVSPMGNCFLAVVILVIQFILQKMFAGWRAKMWLAIRNP